MTHGLVFTDVNTTHANLAMDGNFVCKFSTVVDLLLTYHLCAGWHNYMPSQSV